MKYFIGVIIFVGVAIGAWYWLAPKKEVVNNNMNNNLIVLETSLGNIKIKLDYDAAPKTSANFEKLVKEKFYDNLTFHRIVPGFVIQGGDPKGDGTGGPGYTVPAEIKLLHKRGSIAMARTGDEVNPNRESSGSQFYIALQDLPQLDGQYTVFGSVVEGMDVVDKIAKLNPPVIITSARRL
jgi:peptidyl-prolyl cis-trans isomerase B (cyclophilin B)